MFFEPHRCLSRPRRYRDAAPPRSCPAARRPSEDMPFAVTAAADPAQRLRDAAMRRHEDARAMLRSMRQRSMSSLARRDTSAAPSYAAVNGLKRNIARYR